jgi:hypothetical protein
MRAAILVAGALVPCLPVNLRAQGETPCSPFFTLQSYRTEPVPNVFNSIVTSGAGTPLVFGNADDADAAVVFPPCFTFSYYRIAQTSIRVCTNGFAQFTGLANSTFTNTHPDDTLAPEQAIFPWFDDLHLAGTGTVQYLFDCTPAFETLTVEWNGVRNFPAASTAVFTFQMILYASTHSLLPDRIEFRYDRSTSPNLPACFNALTAAESATVGCEGGFTPIPGNLGGIEATDRGAGNERFPECDIRISPTVKTLALSSASMTTSVQGPFCTIVGLLGTNQVPNSCTGNPCPDEEESAFTGGAQIPFPWKVNFLGRIYSSVNMNPNGLLELGAGNFGGAAANLALPSPTQQNALLAPFWDDLEGAGPGSGMYWRVDGLPGCRVMTFEWVGKGSKAGLTGDCATGGGFLSFQVKIYEGSAAATVPSVPVCPYDVVIPGTGNDRIEYHYDLANFLPGPFSASIGYEDHAGLFVGASLPGTPTITGPPTTPPPVTPMMVTIDTCDCGQVRFYGDRTNNQSITSVPSSLPEIKANCVDPILGNPFGLQMVGSSAGLFPFLAIDLSGGIPGMRTPVPCAGLPFFGITLWVNPSTSVILSYPPTTGGNGLHPGCANASLPIPIFPGLVCAPIFAQWVAVGIISGQIVWEATEGAKIVIG